MWAEHLQPTAGAGFRVIAPELPGLGEARPSSAPWEDVLATMDELGIEQAALVGNSFGGAVALRVAAVAPERVTALGLVSAPHTTSRRPRSCRPPGGPRSRPSSGATSTRRSPPWS